jgi:hypothetical protein
MAVQAWPSGHYEKVLQGETPITWTGTNEDRFISFGGETIDPTRSIAILPASGMESQLFNGIYWWPTTTGLWVHGVAGLFSGDLPWAVGQLGNVRNPIQQGITPCATGTTWTETLVTLGEQVDPEKAHPVAYHQGRMVGWETEYVVGLKLALASNGQQLSIKTKADTAAVNHDVSWAIWPL